MTAITHTYDLFAEIYNRWMAEDFCRRALPVVEKLFLSRLAPPARSSAARNVGGALRILDVCCGSGQMARALGERRLSVTGLDASDEMLRFARQNAPAAEFIRADARSFKLPPIFAGALSTFNSLAHVETVAELESVFRNVHAALVTGALFLFDLSTEEAYTSKWRGSFGLVADDHACIVRPSYDNARRVGRNRVTLFRAAMSSHGVLPAPASQRPVSWHRSDFCIEQKCHTEAELITALNTAGFTRVEAYDAQRDLGMAGEWGRLFFVCS